MKEVFVLEHTHGTSKEDQVENLKRLGVYSKIEEAQKSISLYAKLTGFKDHSDGFLITQCALDKDNNTWKKGFVVEADKNSEEYFHPVSPKRHYQVGPGSEYNAIKRWVDYYYEDPV